MNSIVRFAGMLILGLGMAWAGCGKKRFTSWSYVENPVVAKQLKSFVAEKEVQANLATNDPAPGFAAFFAAAKKGDWPTVRKAFDDFQNHAPQYSHGGTNDMRLSGTAWQAVLETYGGLEAFHNAGEKYFSLYASNIIESIPPGSIYFGGDDDGRFIITAMEKSQTDGDPFFTLTQNALADGTYLDYLRGMYGDKIYIPTSADSQECFREYTEQTGKAHVSDWRAVMAINALVAKVIFDKNPPQDFYVQQSFPLDWMYPYLEPHRLIFRVNREPLDELADDVVQQDRDYWTNIVSPMIGDWLRDDTTVADVAAFAEKVFGRHNFSGFTGDRQFVANEFANGPYASASGEYSFNRKNIADLYVWRMNHTANVDEKERMAREADFAFRQALALCPANSQTTEDYADFLGKQGRNADSSVVFRIGAQVRRGNR